MCFKSHSDEETMESLATVIVGSGVCRGVYMSCDVSWEGVDHAAVHVAEPVT